MASPPDRNNNNDSNKNNNSTKKRKRPAPSKLSDDDDEVATKTRKENTDPVISEVEFKFLLSDRSTVLEGLEKFIRSAENVSSGLPSADIVSGYCRSSQTCSELFAVVDSGSPQLKTNEMALVFRCLEIILTRIRTDLVKFASTGEAIVQKILAGHMGQVYNGLQEHNKSKTIKTCLQLLTAMVSVSERAKKAVQSRLNFGHISFPALFRRRNRKDPTDVRSCAVMLTLAFLVDSDLGTISSLVQQKSFIQQTIAGLKYDRRDLLLDVLATLLDKVVTFPGLSKTDKVKLFSEAVLKQLCELYDWQGPTGWVPAGKKKKKDQEVRVTYEGFPEDQETVANVCHEFLVELCCSHKNGLNFHDKTVGTGQRNHNQLLDHLVAWLVKKIDEHRKAELIIMILCTCPDLIKTTLTNLCPSLTPRWSDKWRELMTWITDLYRRLPDVPPFLESQDYLKNDPLSVISMTTVYCLLPPSVATVITHGMKHEDIRVRDICARLIQVLAKKACAIQGHLSLGVTAARVGDSAFEDNFVNAFCTRVMKTLPPTSQLFICVDKTMQLMSTEHQVSGLDTTVVDEKQSAVDLSGHTSVLLQVLGLYQTLIPSLLSERPKDLAKLIDLVGCLQSHHMRESTGTTETVANKEELIEDDTDKEGDKENIDNVQRWLPQLYLLKLLSDTDAGKISLGREGLMEKLLLSASKSDKFRNLTIGLVCKMLQSMEIFCEHVKELHTWLDIAMSSTTNPNTTNASSSPSLFRPVTFLARCLATFINNPSPYVDRVMEAVGETSKGVGAGDQRHESTRTRTTESAIDAILLMDDRELNSKLDKCEPHVASHQLHLIHLPFSPLAVVALDSLQHGKTADDSEQIYVSTVLVHLLHSLPDPSILARIVTKSETSLSEGVGEYFHYWTGGQPKTSVTRPLPAASVGIFTSALMCEHFGLKSSHGPVVELSNKLRGMASRDQLVGLKQVLLYVGDTLKTPKQNVKCAGTVKTYLCLATALSDHILDEESHKSQSDNSSPEIEGLLNISKNVVDDDVLNKENVSTDELDVFNVLFSRIVLSASESIVADGFKCILLNPTLKKYLFKTAHEVPHVAAKKSPKRNDRNVTADAISELISQFVSSIITKSTNYSWLKSEMDVVEEYVSLMLEELVGRKLSPRLEAVCSQTLQSVSPLLDLAGLSRCIVRLLGLPLSSLVNKCQDDDDNRDGETQAFRTLCGLLKNLKSLIENYPSFIGNAQLTSLICPSSLEQCDRTKDHLHGLRGCGLKGCIQIKTAFSFEDSTRQQVSAFAAVFELLPHSQNDSLREFAIFVLDCLPEMAAIFRPTLFDELFKNPLTTLSSSLEKVLISVIKNVKGCFLLYEEWLSKHVHTVIIQRKWFFISIYMEANIKFSGGYTKTVEAVKQSASSSLKKLDAESFSQSLPCLKLLSLAVQNMDSAFQQLLTDTIVGHIRKHEDCQLMHFTVLEVSSGFCMGLSSTRPPGQSSQGLILELAVGHLTYLIVSGDAESSSLKESLAEMAVNMATKLAHSHWKLFLPCWLNLIQNTVKHRLTDAKLLKLVANMAENIFSEHQDSPATQSLFEQCVGHPMFHTVMTSSEFTDAKVELVKLLFILGEIHPSCYKGDEISSVLASAYTASLSLTDQRLLLMMKRSSQSMGTKFECPTLWGRSALDHQEASKVLGQSLHRQAPSQTILEQFNSELMLDSILHFPVRRLHSDKAVVDASEFKSRPQCYDPAFLLKLFVQILSPDKQVPLRAFVEKDCLSYLLIALSSHDLDNRLLAYHALNDFYLHTDGSRWHDKMEMAFILDLLNASRVKDGQKLPFVVALFFARTVKLLLYPADPMYVPIFRFLVARPDVDLGNVPEFYKLFFSAGVQYKHERNWMLSLLCDGMRETSDYWLYQKKFIFKILLSYYDSTISDAHSQELILLMVKNACKEKSVAVDLVKNHGLMPWLATAITSLEHQPEQADHLCDIIHTLWFSLTEIRYLTQSQLTSKKPLTSSSVATTEAMETVDSEPQEKVDDGHIHAQSSNRTSLQKKSTDSELETCFSSDEDGQDDHNMPREGDSHSNVGQSAKLSLPTVPRSTLVEMALVTKSLIWHLSCSSVDGLVKVLQVLQGMTSSETSNMQLPQSGSSLDTSSPTNNEAQPSSHSQNLLNISTLESCLLLYHVAKAAQQTATSDIAASVLKSKGVDFERRIKKFNRKPASRKEHSLAKEGNTELSLIGVANLEDNTSKEVNKSSKLTDESDPQFLKIVKNSQIKSVVSEDNKRQLFRLFNNIIMSSRTLEFV